MTWRRITSHTIRRPTLADTLISKKKYRQERDRRLQAQAPTEPDSNLKLEGFFEDPNTAGSARAPIIDEKDVIIIGGGHSGVLSAIALRKAGVDSFRMIEAGYDFGGVWYWNRYPGVACDVESYIYMPFLEETGYMPSECYAKGDEIRAHFDRLAAKFRLNEIVCFGTQVTRVEWVESENRWLVSTNHGDQMKARFVMMGNGALSHPKLPAILGIETFKGRIFHTSRWDFDYTGGDQSGNLAYLKDKRVAVIGTGATAAQVVPQLGEWAKQLYVVQRTPAIVAARGNAPTDPAWVNSLRPGWQQQRIANFDAILSGAQEENLVADVWSDIWGPPHIPADTPPEPIARR